MNEKPVFATAVIADDLYPMLESIDIEIKELLNPGWKKAEKIYRVNKGNLRTYFRCTNPLCSGGGASIATIIDQAIANKETKVLAGEHCGHNESGGRSCLHYFSVEGLIIYK